MDTPKEIGYDAIAVFAESGPAYRQAGAAASR